MPNKIEIEPQNYTLNLVQLEAIGTEFLLLMSDIENANGSHLEFTGTYSNLMAFRKTLENFKKEVD